MMYWVIIGIFQLCILTYQDIFHKQLVDDRANYFMIGLTVSLVSHYDQKLSYLAALAVIVILLSYIFNKFNVVGSADIKTIMWSFTGFGFASPAFLVYYMLSFVILYLVYMTLNRIISRDRKVIPLYPVFLISFAVIGIWVF